MLVSNRVKSYYAVLLLRVLNNQNSLIAHQYIYIYQNFRSNLQKESLNSSFERIQRGLRQISGEAYGRLGRTRKLSRDLW